MRDEVKLKTGFFRSMVSEMITNKLRKAYGSDIGVCIHDLDVIHDSEDNKVILQANITCECAPSTIKKFLIK